MSSNQTPSSERRDGLAPGDADWLWPIAESLRSTAGRLSAQTLLREALDRGYRPHRRDLGQFSRIDTMSPEHADPAIVAEFVAVLSTGLGPCRVLDPWAGYGMTMAALAEAGLLRRGLAVEINEGVLGVARDISQDPRIEWVRGDASEVLTNRSDCFDLVVGSPPIGLPRTRLLVAEPPVACLPAAHTPCSCRPA